MDPHDLTSETGRVTNRSWLLFAVLLTIAVALALTAFGKAYVDDMLPDKVVTSAGGSEKPLRVVVARTAGGPGEWIAYQRVLAYLSEHLGRRFETRFVDKEDMAPKAVEEGADLAFVCAHTYITLDKKGVARMNHAQIAWQLSQFMHGEQGALIVASQLVGAVPWMDAKYYAATQTMDEARHVEVFSRYLRDKLEWEWPINPNLKKLLDQILQRDGLHCLG
jgi:hypothetical protein